MVRANRIPIRLLAALLLVPLVLALFATRPAKAVSTTITFNNFSDISTIQLSGNTAGIANPVNVSGHHVLRLTNALSQAGGAFLRDPIPLVDAGGFKASFSTAFQFQITNPMGCVDTDGVQGADGLVFVVQTTSNQYGGPGGGLGYYGIPKSVGIEFDTWNNGGVDDNNGNHVGIDVNGSVDSVVRQAVGTPMNNGAVWHAWVDYNGDTQLLEVRLSQSPVRPAAALISHTIDLPAVLEQPDAYVGFTSGTGCAGGFHDLRSWEFTNTFNPINACPDGFTWKAPLSSSGTYNMPAGSNLPIAFQYCPGGEFAHDESVILVVQDRANPDYPITAWVYGSDIVIDDAAQEYSQTFQSGLYSLAPGAMLDVYAYIGGSLVGQAAIQIAP